MADKNYQFPSYFLWGAATSAYQIEGGLINDWSEWEKSTQRLRYLEKQDLNPVDFQSGLACNSWHMLDQDIACLKKIKATAYRFSIDWSRIEPEEGKFDKAALSRYANFVGRLREENIEPMVTLWHFTLPLWLKNKGGFTNTKIVDYFKSYVERVVLALPTVKLWQTINEPTVYAGDSYLKGVWPPQKKNFFSYLKVLRNLAKAHRSAYLVIKNSNQGALVGIATHNIYFQAEPGLINKILQRGANWWWNHYWLDKIRRQQDFIGLNFYFHNLIKNGFSKNKNEVVSDLGWELYPQGLEPLLIDLWQRYHKPIYVTENGLADAQDKHRAWYLQTALASVYSALKQGVDVRGYFHWSLIDNFEWAHGFAPKFGLFAVDYKTFVRTPRPSALIYAKIINNNSLTF